MDKNILVIDSAWPINSRTNRFCSTLSKKYVVSVCAWNRSGVKGDYKKNQHVLESNAPYGNAIKKLMRLPFFLFHIIKVMRAVQPDLILSSHWDVLFLTRIAMFFVKRKSMVVYDCLDLPTSNNALALHVIRFFEKVFCYKVNLIVLASRYFSVFYSNANELIFENYPSRVVCDKSNLGSSLNILSKFRSIKDDSVTYISWVGVVRYPEILKNISEVIRLSGGKLELLVFGDGPYLKWFSDYVIDSGISSCVHFFGRYEQTDLVDIYDCSDFVWAAYPSEDFNVKYAISNKYFECSYFCKPIIISRRTEMAKDTVDNSSVIAIDEYDASDILKVILLSISLSDRGHAYVKYEADINWESREHVFLAKIGKLFLNGNTDA